jgi:broad specificity phosphatase PhoE
VLERLHLVRHGEVDNPGHVVYADLPGFSLSAAGRAQAQAAAEHLAPLAPDAVLSSPLDRARETATAIAAAVDVAVAVDERLTEWRLSTRWAGVCWEDLPTRFPGELEAYLATPLDLPFAPESIAAATRMASVIDSLDATGNRTAVFVSHQDPVQALRAFLRGDMASFPVGKPGHASVVTFARASGTWHEAGYWEPDIPSEPFPPTRS